MGQTRRQVGARRDHRDSQGVKHWHGAAKDSWMQHLTYHKDVQEGASNEWLEPVTDDQYGALK